MDRGANIISHQKDLGERTSSTRNEPTSEVQSLRSQMGRLQREMGDRAQRTEVPRPKSDSKKRSADTESAAKRLRTGGVINPTDTQQTFGTYRPKTRETRAAYEEFLSSLQSQLGDADHQTLVDCADDLLEVLRDTKIKDGDKKTGVEGVMLQPVTDDYFRKLLNISKQMHDYVHHTDEKQEVEVIAEDQAVSVVFQDSDDEKGDDIEMEIRPSRKKKEEKKEDKGPDPEDDEDEEGGEETRQDVGISGAMGDEDDDETQERDYLDAKRIDAHWIQREMGKLEENEEAHETQNRAEQVFQALADENQNDQQVEGALLLLFQFHKFEFIKKCLKNRKKIVWCTKINRSKGAQREEIIAQLRSKEYGQAILDELEKEVKRTDVEAKEFRTLLKKQQAEGRFAEDKTKNLLDLRELQFEQEGRLIASTHCKLPAGSFRKQEQGYEEMHIPALKPKTVEKEKLIKIDSMPEWCHAAFKGMTYLNPIQSGCFPCAFKSNENMLLCAPTGAGKTNVALLTVLQQMAQFVDENGEIDHEAMTENMKIVYVAPMKALVQEVVTNFGRRLEEYDVKVSELTGDHSMTKSEIDKSHIIVTTPEKWDIVTRRAGERTFLQHVKLIIIDEIHLLHDSRGPVLEAIIARTIRQIEMTQEWIRLVGLSATLPNYEDVAAVMRVKRADDTSPGGLFHFDNSYRPVPLQQQYIGVTEKKPLKRLQVMNEIVYKKVMEQAGRNQVIVFVHSRKDTAKTARAIRDMALEQDTLGRFLRDDSYRREILQEEAQSVKDPSLRDLLPYGFGIHHAGLNVKDRVLVEELFADKHLQVLVSTATLAWGVNLPAHTVIIKGTQIYNPEKGKWVELSALDAMQMMGRAGRIQFDEKGEGIIITSRTELQYYLSLMNQQLPIESQFITRLVDQLNAEIVLGTVQNTKDANHWLGYTYLYVRMLRRPELYGVAREDMEDDPQLEQRRADLVHTAASALDKASLIKYDRKSGSFQATDLGKVASHYYLSHGTVMKFNEHLKPTMHELEIFRLFSMADEFKYMSVRDEEKLELQKLLERVPIPVKESIDDPCAKVNVLLQAYISQLKLDGFALMADMVYITQSAPRLMRAICEIVLKRGWASLTDRCLTIAKMIEKRMWLSHSPLRQFKGIRLETIQKLERKDFAWERYYNLSLSDVTTLVGDPKVGKAVFKCIHTLPKLDLSAHAQPITRSLLRVELTITADFQFDRKVHGASETFLIIVEDPDGEQILHWEPFVLKEKYAREEHFVYFHVPLFEPLPPQYFIRVVSERWLWSETVLPVSFRQLLLPEKAMGHTQLLDLKPLPVSALQNDQFEKLYSDFPHFNSIQTQVFHTLYNTNDNCLVCAPTGSGKTVCAEFALLHLFAEAKEQRTRAVYVASLPDVAKQTYKLWKERFGMRMGKKVVMLTGETIGDLKLLEIGEIIIATAEQWDQISRRWQRRKNVTSVRLFIVDELHLIGSKNGPTLEIVVSRMRYIASQLKDHKIRIVGLAYSLLHAKDVSLWIGAPPQAVYNFHPSVRPVPLDIQLMGFDQVASSSRTLAMYKPTYMAIKYQARDKPVIIFTPSKKITYEMVIELITFCSNESNPKHFLHCDEEDIQAHTELINDKLLKKAITYGIGFFDEGQSDKERTIVTRLNQIGAIQVIVAPYTLCWKMEVSSYMTVIAGTQFYDGREHRHADYFLSDILQMLGRACRPMQDESSVALIMCHSSKKDFLKRMLHDMYPVESHLDHYIIDHLNAEIVAKSIETKQDAVDYLTWTFLYRRIRQNPNYYRLFGVSHEHISEYLSELTENSIQSLVTAGCITIDETKQDGEVVEAMAPANLGMIASYYYTMYTTIELFASSLQPKTKLRSLIEILSSASEFEEVIIRHHEEEKLEKLSKHCQIKGGELKFSDPHTKVNILLHCHFSRRAINPDLQEDLKELLPKCIPLISAMVDVVGSNRWLGPLLAAMELSQMVVQGMWDRDSVLLQLPHFTPEMAKRCADAGITSIFDLTEKEPEERSKLLQLTDRQMANVAMVCNSYPSISVDYEVVDSDDVHQGSNMTVQVSLERDIDENEPVPRVHCPLYPKEKDEGWWLVVGNTKKNHVYAVKRCILQRKQKVKIDFVAPEQGDQEMNLFLMSDCYLGADQEYEFKVKVKEPLADSSDDEDDED